MSNLIEELKRSIADGLTDRSLTSCSRWAANRRVMGEPFPGPYSWTYHPWVRELHDSSASFNYAMKSAQAGVTEVAINRALYVLDRLRRDVLYVLPTSLNASDFSKARFATALALSPKLAQIFTDTNTVNLKQAGANTLYIRGSRGDSNLKSIPVSELFLDEIDEMDQKQIWLALERLSGQVHKHVWGISTPTIPNYGIHKLYMTSTQEHFVFMCPCCSRWTEFVWPDCIEIIGEHVADVRCHESFLKCKQCKGKLVHETKPDWLGTGTWNVTAKNANPDIRGFHVNQLYSFTVTPGELVVAYFRGFGDELANKEFHNSKLGLPFIGDGNPAGPVQLELDRIPFVMLDIGDSLIKDVCQHQIALLNLGSSDVNHALKANFPFYIEQRDLRAVGGHLKVAASADGTATEGGQGAADTDIKVGSTQGRAYDIKANAPAFIAPPSEPLEASLQLQAKLEEDVRKLVNLAVVNLATRASAESKQMDNQGLEAGLSYIGLVLESAERRVAEFWAAYEERRQTRRQVATVKYPDRYSLKSDEERIDEADKLAKLMHKMPGRTVKREIAKNIVTVLLAGKVSVERIERIHREIDASHYTTSDPKIIIDAKNAGLVGEKTASVALGFDDNEHLTAREDHTARILRIAAAQSNDATPSRPFLAHCKTPLFRTRRTTRRRSLRCCGR